MHFKNHMMAVLGCAALLSLTVPALSQPLPQPKPGAVSLAGNKQKKLSPHHAVQPKPNQQEARLVSMAVIHEPKRPAFGWPVLVSEARKYIGTNPTDRKRLWCATFMNMVLTKAGYAGTNSDAAMSFAQYGHRISEPKVGAIAVLTRGRHGGHVGVVSGIDANGNPIIISGNHGRKVGEAIYPRSRVIAYVMPSEHHSGNAQIAERGTLNRSVPGASLESPIAELLAAIEAEQSRPDSRQQASRQAFARQDAARQTTPGARAAQHVNARPVPEPSASLPIDPGLAAFLGINERPQTAQRPVPKREQPQREQRVEQYPSGRVADDTRLAGFLGLPQAR